MFQHNDILKSNNNKHNNHLSICICSFHVCRVLLSCTLNTVNMAKCILMMKSQWFTRNILRSLMCNRRGCERKNMHLMKWDHFALCYSHQTDCNQWVGVEIKHSQSSHDDRLYLHERNEYVAEVAWCVWLNGFLQRLLVGCQVWEQDMWRVKDSQNNKVILKGLFLFF